MSYSLNSNLSHIPQSDFHYKIIEESKSQTEFKHFEVPEKQIDEDFATIQQSLKELRDAKPSMVETTEKVVEITEKVEFNKNRSGKRKNFRNKTQTTNFEDEETTDISTIKKINSRKRTLEFNFSTKKQTEEESPPISLREASLPLPKEDLDVPQIPLFSLKKEFVKEGTILEEVSDIFASTVRPSNYLITEFKGDDLKDLRFSQRTIQASLGESDIFLFHDPRTQKDYTLFDILRKEGWKTGDKYKITVILMPDGRYSSFDNRRLAVAKTINELFSHSIIVPAHSHRYSESAPSNFMNRLGLFGRVPDPIEGIVANTYGHALTVRVAGSVKGHLNETETYGFDRYPQVITGLRGKGAKVIHIDKKNGTVNLG